MSIHERPDKPSERVGKSAAQARTGHPSARHGRGAAERQALADRVKVERKDGWIRVTLTRRYKRQFSLSDDEADYLRGQLGRFVGPVVVSRVEDREARS